MNQEQGARSVAELRSLVIAYRDGEADCRQCKDALWKVILAYEGETFITMKGLEFSYVIKKKRNGEKSNEIAISRKEKTITRSTVEMSFDRVMELSGVVKGPKQIGTFGASYLYPMFLQFGLICL